MVFTFIVETWHLLKLIVKSIFRWLSKYYILLNWSLPPPINRGGKDFWCYGMTHKSFELQPGGQIVITLCNLPVRFHCHSQCPQKYQARHCYLLTNPSHGVKRILEPGVCIGTLVKEAQFDVDSIDYEKLCCSLCRTKKEHFFYILSLCLVYYVVSICLYYFVSYVLPWLIFL
jgi:hypothetical protein